MLKLLLKKSIKMAVLFVFAALFMSCDKKVYGLMNISYNDFYAAELESGKNNYSVDGVSSATTKKWFRNGAGELFEGTVNKANEDGSGTITGVRFPVEISEKLIDTLESEYNFELLEEKPAAYKKAELTKSGIRFSQVQSENQVRTKDFEFDFSTETPWGDYVIKCSNLPEDFGAIYGVILQTTDGCKYAMRHEENIWRKEIAWSTGIVTTEPHGNKLSFKNFESIVGKTISEIEYITMKGITFAETSLPVLAKESAE